MNTVGKKLAPIRQVEVIAHRGARTDKNHNKIAPENTMPAFVAAAQQGASNETDIFALKHNNHLWIHHDLDTGRMFQLPGQQKPFHTLMQDELDSLRLNKKGHEATVNQLLGPGGNYKTPPQFESVTVPELENTLTALPNTHFYVELKVPRPDLLHTGHHQLEEKTARLIHEKNLYDQVKVISFSPRSLRKIKALDPKIKTGLNFTLPKLVRNNPIFLKWFVNQYAKNWVGVNSIHPSYDTLSPKMVELAHRNEMPVITWVYHETRSEEKKMFPKLLDMGVDGIITNAIDLLNEEVRTHASSTHPTQAKVSFRGL